MIFKTSFIEQIILIQIWMKCKDYDLSDNIQSFYFNISLFFGGNVPKTTDLQNATCYIYDAL